MRNSLFFPSLFGALLVWFASAVPQAQALQYRLVDLGTLGGATSAASSVNGKGQVTGSSTLTDGTYRPFIWSDVNGNGISDPGEMVALSLGGNPGNGFKINEKGQITGSIYPTDSSSRAYFWSDNNENGKDDPGETYGLDVGTNPFDINSSGQVVGDSSNLAFIYTGGHVSHIPFLSGGLSLARGINESGQVVGWVQKSGAILSAFLYKDGKVILLEGDSNAADVNDFGMVMGEIKVGNGSYHAFAWRDVNGNDISDPGELVDLGTLGGRDSEGEGINNQGQVIGTSAVDNASGAFSQAFVWSDVNKNGQSDPGEMIPMSLGGNSYPNAINEKGQVVGRADPPGDIHSQHAFLYDGGNVIDLNRFVPEGSGWTLYSANSINDAGQIVGIGFLNGKDRAFLLNPAPEKSPVTTASATVIGGAYASGEWTNGGVNVTLSALDYTGGTNIREIDYRVNGGEPVTVPGSTATLPVIDSTGTTLLTYHAVDGAGTVEAPDKKFTVRIDRSPPDTNSTVEGVLVGQSYEDSVTLRLSAADSLSGVDTIYYGLDAPACGPDDVTACSAYTAPLTVNTGGPHELVYFSRDHVGNVEPRKTLAFSVRLVHPRALDGLAITSEDTPKEITLVADYDGEGPLTYTVVHGPAHGTLSAPDGNRVTYTPAPDYFGADAFTFKASAGAHESNTAAVSLTVTSVNDAPVAQDIALQTVQNRPVEATLHATDAEGDALTYRVLTPPQHGLLSGTGPDLTYTPDSDFSGTDAFTFVANDGALDSAPATVTVTIPAPWITFSSATAAPGDGPVLSVSLTDALADRLTGLDLRLTVSAPPGAPPLKPAFSTGAQTQDWTLLADPRKPWAASVVSFDGVNGPAELLKLRLEVDPSTPPGTVYEISAAAGYSDAAGADHAIPTERLGVGRVTVTSCVPRAKGDVNGDAQVDVSDAVAVLRMVVGLDPVPNECVRAATDVNCDGEIGVGDAVLVLRNIVLGDPFPDCS